MVYLEIGSVCLWLTTSGCGRGHSNNFTRMQGFVELTSCPNLALAAPKRDTTGYLCRSCCRATGELVVIGQACGQRVCKSCMRVDLYSSRT